MTNNQTQPVPPAFEPNASDVANNPFIESKNPHAEFLPEWYEVPVTWGNYLKLEEWNTKIRILTVPLMGWEYFTEDNKPVRFEYKNKPKETPKIKEWKKLKEFWALVIWNYIKESIQIWQISQSTIKQKIEGLFKNPDWGTPLLYDISINKKWEWLDTKYEIIPSPNGKWAEPVPSIKKAFAEAKIDLTKLFTWENPFWNDK